MSETAKTYDGQAAAQSVAWRVELPPGSCIVFAPTNAKARYQAVKAYWDAYGRDQAWPNCNVTRAAVYDRCKLRNSPPKAWSEDYVRDCP